MSLDIFRQDLLNVHTCMHHKPGLTRLKLLYTTCINRCMSYESTISNQVVVLMYCPVDWYKNG